MINKIDLKELPPIVGNYYDKGPSNKRLLSAHTRLVGHKKAVLEYVVIHTYGRDYWRQDRWGDWKLWKTSDPDSVYKYEV